jgi:hypothetical protein
VNNEHYLNQTIKTLFRVIEKETSPITGKLTTNRIKAIADLANSLANLASVANQLELESKRQDTER